MLSALNATFDQSHEIAEWTQETFYWERIPFHEDSKRAFIVKEIVLERDSVPKAKSEWTTGIFDLSTVKPS